MNEISTDTEMLIRASMGLLADTTVVVPVAGLSNHYIGLSEVNDKNYRHILSREIDGKKVHLYFKR